MKIYEENQFTKSKLDDRRNNSLGLEDSDEKVIELSFSDVKALAALVINYSEKHEMDDQSIKGSIRPKSKIQIPTKYGYICWFVIGNGMDHENQVDIDFDLERKDKNITYRPKNNKQVGSHWVSDEFKEGKYMHQVSTLDSGGPHSGKTHFRIMNWPN